MFGHGCDFASLSIWNLAVNSHFHYIALFKSIQDLVIGLYESCTYTSLYTIFGMLIIYASHVIQVLNCMWAEVSMSLYTPVCVSREGGLYG